MPADLKSIPLFQGVQESDLRALAERTVTRSYPKQAIIVSEGDESDSLYLILAGRVKIYLADQNGKELILAIKGPGQYFGEMVLDEQPRSASVMTLEPAQFAILSRADFRAFLLKHPEVSLQLIQNLIRVARILLELAVERDGKMVIPERLARDDQPHPARSHHRRLRQRRGGAHHHQQGPAAALVGEDRTSALCLSFLARARAAA